MRKKRASVWDLLRSREIDYLCRGSPAFLRGDQRGPFKKSFLALVSGETENPCRGEKNIENRRALQI